VAYDHREISKIMKINNNNTVRVSYTEQDTPHEWLKRPKFIIMTRKFTKILSFTTVG
jgi:hypothetical protein